MKRTLAVLAALFALAAVALGAAFWFGAYDISATRQHWAPTYRALDAAMRRAVIQRAKHIDVPPLGDARQLARGAARYREHCVQCHGAPGIAPEAFALGMTPVAANLVYTARAWRPAELFWTIREGIKMTGMPAWTHRMHDDDIWAVVAFLQLLPSLSPQDYAKFVEASAAPGPLPREAAAEASRPDVERGRAAIQQYACVTCHAIPGIVGSGAPVGPPLAGIATRSYIAGVLPNRGDAMIRWLLSPKTYKPLGAMPDLHISEKDAADIAAYLSTLR